MRNIKDAEIKGKNVLVRIDADVPIVDGVVENARRLEASLPTLKYLLEGGAKVTIIGHIGRPDGKVVEELKMRPVEDALIKIIGTHQNWQILENLRFNKGEEENDANFAAQLAAGQDLFVQDAFATCHRKHASTSAITEILPSYAGLSVQKEVEKLSSLLEKIEHPFTVILGGAKIADKLPVIKNLMSKADNFLIGGAIASTFLMARRHYLGKSLIEKESFNDANKIWKDLMDDSHKALYLPKDLVLSMDIKKPEDVQEINIEDLLNPGQYDEYSAVDIGPNTIEQYQTVIKDSKTIFWNGNMGISEVKEFANGTVDIAHAIVDSGATAVIGGGDTVTAVGNLNIENDKIFLSTGGGATLEFLAGKELPGLKVLGY